ncbi:restriction endonuclease subunit S [Glaesserella parasuis]|uniref:restriction endonuclease subunit S n=1 Tax=Glaesserella parasuis TaxID=738 RepID=UPI003CED3E62
MKFKQYEFSDIAEYITTKIDITSIEQDKYISTDNMLANFGGVSIADSLPATERCNSFKKRDILFSNIRTYFKKVWFAGFDGGCSADVLVIRSKNEEIVLNEFLYLLICSEEFINFTIASSNGAKMPRGDKNAIKKYVFNIPNIEYQKQCIAQYFNLNKKIQLNTQINQTLEQIAQTIFKSWFIDFDPVHAKANALASGQTAEQATQAAMAVISGKNTQELHRLQTANPEQYQQLWEIAEAFPGGFDEEGVPRGWGYEKSENLFDVGIGKTPPRKEPEWFSENSNDIEWISIKDMGNSEVFVNKSSEYLLESAVNKFNVKRIPENTVILSFKLTVGRVGITTKETTTNEAIAHFRLCEKSYLTTEFLYLYLKNFDFNNLGSTSSIATAVNSKTIKEMEILYPTLEIINVFQYRVSDIFKAIRVNSEQSNCLEKIRNELLPKLLSGELNGLPEKAI